MNQYIQTLQQNVFIKMYLNQGINYLALFGSVARDEASPHSDVDLLIGFTQPKSLFELANIKMFFEEKLSRKVDLVSRKSLKSQLKPHIEQDLITVYEQN